MTENNSFDPIAWANMNNETPTTSSSAVRLVAPSSNDDVRSQMLQLADYLAGHGIDITAGYQNWLTLGFALADGLGEEGRAVYHNLSRLNAGYNSSDCDRQYSACLKSHGHGITAKSFFYLAKTAGVDLSRVFSSSATSAIPPTAKTNEKVVKSSIFGVSDKQMADGGMAEVAETMPSSGTGYTFSDKLKVEDLSSILRVIYDLHCQETAKCDAQILGALNAIGGLMGGANGSPEERSGVYGVYDGRRVYAPTYNIIYSGAGNDKGNLLFCKYLLNAVKKEMRRQYEAEKLDYDNELMAWESKKKDRGPAPQEPVYRDPFVPGNSSSSAVYRAIDANGGWGMMFETEADTVSAMIDSDYGNYSDLLRKAHHHETLSMNRVTDKVHIDIEEPRLSVFLTCTPGQLPALFPSFENGLGSRFLFYNTPDENVTFHNVFARVDTPLEDKYKQLGEQLLPLYHALKARAGHPIQFVMSPQQQQEFIQTYSGVLQEQFSMLGKGIRAFIFRMALECFRYAMILTTLRKLYDWQTGGGTDESAIFSDKENALVCDDRDFHTAMTIMGCLINHTARVYAVLQKDDDNPFALKGIKLTANELRVYNALPVGDFTTADFIEIAVGPNISERTAQRMLSQLCNKYRIINPVRRGIYSKPARKEDNND